MHFMTSEDIFPATVQRYGKLMVPAGIFVISPKARTASLQKKNHPSLGAPCLFDTLPATKASVLDLVAKAMLVLPVTEIQVWASPWLPSLQLTGCTYEIDGWTTFDSLRGWHVSR